MPFSITIQNDGVDGTIEVTERLNDNQNIQVFNDVIEAGGSRIVNGIQGTPPKDFTWIHHATNLEGGPDSKGDGDTIRVQS
jgi:hypothetical protein